MSIFLNYELYEIGLRNLCKGEMSFSTEQKLKRWKQEVRKHILAELFLEKC